MYADVILLWCHFAPPPSSESRIARGPQSRFCCLVLCCTDWMTDWLANLTARLAHWLILAINNSSWYFIFYLYFVFCFFFYIFFFIARGVGFRVFPIFVDFHSNFPFVHSRAKFFPSARYSIIFFSEEGRLKKVKKFKIQFFFIGRSVGRSIGHRC